MSKERAWCQAGEQQNPHPPGLPPAINTAQPSAGRAALLHTPRNTIYIPGTGPASEARAAPGCLPGAQIPWFLCLLGAPQPTPYT